MRKTKHFTKLISFTNVILFLLQNEKTGLLNFALQYFEC